MISVSEAQSLILKEARSFGSEKVSLEKSIGRVLAQNAVADRDYPPFNRSAMDGFAVVAKGFLSGANYAIGTTIFAGDASPRTLRSPREKSSLQSIKIMTGAAVPPPFDAVIRKEEAIVKGDTVQFNLENLKTWNNISRQGEDLKRGEKLSVQGCVIDNATITVLASLGIAKPQVARWPKVAIISTGNEIVPPTKKPKPTEIRNSNVFALRAQLAGYGIDKITTTHVPDDERKLAAAIRRLGNCDILLLTGGVSAGDSDHVPDVLARLKYRKIFHKVQIKPGKPLWFGVKGKTTVFAIPGNPFSAQVIFKILIEPYLRKCLGQAAASAIRLSLSESRRKKDTMENYFPVRLEAGASGISTLSTIPFNGSGDVRAALFSDGIAMHPADMREIAAGNIVNFYPWRPF